MDDQETRILGGIVGGIVGGILGGIAGGILGRIVGGIIGGILGGLILGVILGVIMGAGEEESYGSDVGGILGGILGVITGVLFAVISDGVISEQVGLLVMIPVCGILGYFIGAILGVLLGGISGGIGRVILFLITLLMDIQDKREQNHRIKREQEQEQRIEREQEQRTLWEQNQRIYNEQEQQIKIEQEQRRKHKEQEQKRKHEEREQYLRMLEKISPETAEEAIKWLNKIQTEVDKFLNLKQYEKVIPLLETKTRLYIFAISSFKELGLDSMIPSLENELSKHKKLEYDTSQIIWANNYESFSNKLEKVRKVENFETIDSAITDLIKHMDIRINLAKDWSNEEDIEEYSRIKKKFETMKTISGLTEKYKLTEKIYNNLVSMTERGELTHAINESKKLKGDLDLLQNKLQSHTGTISELSSILNAVETLMERLNRFNLDISGAFQAKLKGISAPTVDLSRVSAQISLPEITKIKISKIHIPLYSKIVLLGESSVGKTHLVLSMTNAEYSHTQGSTVGVDKYYKTVKLPIEGYDPQMCFWDLGGQWNFRAVNELFLNEASVILLVFDMTRPETFEELKYWIEMVKIARGLDKDNIFIIGNKIDVGGSAISMNRINEFLDSNGISIKRYYKTSAVTKHNIDVLVEDIAGAVDWSALMKEIPPEVLSSVENILKKLRLDKKILKFTDLMREFEQRLEGIDQILLKAILKNNATQEIVQFGHHEVFIILDPEIIDKSIAKIIGLAAESNGTVTFDGIKQLKKLRSLDNKQKNLLMEYLEQENVCYPVRDGVWLFPHVIHDEKIKVEKMTLDILDSGSVSGGIKFIGPGDLIFSRFTVLVSHEFGIPEKMSNIAAVWTIGRGHNKTAVMGQFISSPEGGVVRLKSGGGRGKKILDQVFEMLNQILSAYASKTENKRVI